MSAVFNLNMTSGEARVALYKAAEGKSTDEVKALKRDYIEIIDKIRLRDKERFRDCLTTEPLE